MFRSNHRFAVPIPVCLSAAGLAAVVALGGCSGHDGESDAVGADSGSGSISTSASATPGESATPTPTVDTAPSVAPYNPATAEGPAENVPLPVMPELAKQESQEGLEAFAEYWYMLANYGYETGDLSQIREISGEECLSCNSYFRVVEGGYRDGDWMMGAKVTIQDVNSNFVRTDQGYYQATTMFLQEDLHFYEIEGFIGTQPGSYTPVIQLIEATYTPKGWYAIHIETLEM